MNTDAHVPATAGPLDIRTEVSGDGVRTLRLGGAIELADRDRLHAEFDDALTARPPALEVDLTEVGFCGSTGLEALVRLQEGGAQAGVPVRIHPTPRLRRLVGLTGLDGTLNLAEPETP